MRSAPCLFATEVPDPKKPGRLKRKYLPKDVMTPLDKLATLADATTFLRAGFTLESLTRTACALTDLQAAEQLYQARTTLFRAALKRSA